MAIDTENKRRSTLARLPVPDGEIDVCDRRQVCWLYCFAIVEFTIPGLEWTPKENRMHFDASGTRCHFTTKENRMHFDVPGDT